MRGTRLFILVLGLLIGSTQAMGQCGKLLNWGVFKRSEKEVTLQTIRFIRDVVATSQSYEAATKSGGEAFLAIGGIGLGGSTAGENYEEWSRAFLSEKEERLVERYRASQIAQSASVTLLNAFLECMAAQGLKGFLVRTEDPNEFALVLDYRVPHPEIPSLTAEIDLGPKLKTSDSTVVSLNYAERVAIRINRLTCSTSTTINVSVDRGTAPEPLLLAANCPKPPLNSTLIVGSFSFNAVGGGKGLDVTYNHPRFMEFDIGKKVNQRVRIVRIEPKSLPAGDLAEKTRFDTDWDGETVTITAKLLDRKMPAAYFAPIYAVTYEELGAR